jgi:hypothetical protein
MGIIVVRKTGGTATKKDTKRQTEIIQARMEESG